MTLCGHHQLFSITTLIFSDFNVNKGRFPSQQITNAWKYDKTLSICLSTKSNLKEKWRNAIKTILDVEFFTLESQQ